MINEILWIVLMLFSFAGVMLAYRLFGRLGLYMWMAISVILANIQVMKTVEIFGLVTALGSIVYSTTFLATDILNENYGKKAAHKAVWIGFFVLITVTVLMQICLFFVPHESDVLSPALEQIFGFLPRIAFASLLAYTISQNHDVWAYGFWKKFFKGKHLWLRNNLSTCVSQLIDNIIFTYIAFVGLFGLFRWQQIFSWDIIFQIFIVSYILKLVVSVSDTPFIYLSRFFKKKYKLN
ncbi:MAG: queuosine precursor transporter [Nanoarchaeota archaeon]|nr:queuosine precursor transporter [Nanoarchaeota archaeon]